MAAVASLFGNPVSSFLHLLVAVSVITELFGLTDGIVSLAAVSVSLFSSVSAHISSVIELFHEVHGVTHLFLASFNSCFGSLVDFITHLASLSLDVLADKFSAAFVIRTELEAAGLGCGAVFVGVLGTLLHESTGFKIKVRALHRSL